MAPASALLRGPQYRSGSAPWRGPESLPLRIAVQGRFFRPPHGPPPARSSVVLNFCPGDGPLLYFIRSLAIGRNRDNRGPMQQIAVPRPAHLRDETENVATIQNSDRRRAAMG